MKRRYPLITPEELTPESFVREAIRNFRPARLIAIWRPTLAEHVRRRGMGDAPAIHWLGFFKRATRHGVPLDELRYSDVRRWLRGDWQSPCITQRMVLDYLDEHGLAIHVVEERSPTLSRPMFLLEHPESPGRWHSTALRDESFRCRYGVQIERGGLLDPPEWQGRWVSRIRLPDQDLVLEDHHGDDLEVNLRRSHTLLASIANEPCAPVERYRWQTLSGGRDYREILFTVPDLCPAFTSPHHTTSNVLCHVRLTTRTCSEGRHLLHIEELQSDWNNPRSGQPPLLRRLWMRIALQWCVQEAATRGLDGVSLTPGEIVARRAGPDARPFIERTYRQAERQLAGILDAPSARMGTVTYRCHDRPIVPRRYGPGFGLIDLRTGEATLDEWTESIDEAWQLAERSVAREDHQVPALLLDPAEASAAGGRWFDPVGQPGRDAAGEQASPNCARDRAVA